MFKENDKVSAYKVSKNNYNLTQFLSQPQKSYNNNYFFFLEKA